MMLEEIVKRFEQKYRKQIRVIGVSTMIRYKDGYLFTLAKEKYWTSYNDGIKIPYNCVGGKVEKNESFHDAVMREAQEEIDSRLNIISGKITFYVDKEKIIRQVRIEDKYIPRIIFEQQLPGKPGEPLADGVWYLLVSVYYSELINKPRPSSEVPAIIILNRDMYRSCLQIRKLSDIIKQGGLLLQQRTIPDNVYIEPRFTPKIVGELFSNKLEEIFPL